MNKRLWLATLAAGSLLTASAIGAPMAGAAEEEDSAEGPDVAITGDALGRASEAALEYLGEGRVTETEVGDEEGYYEVEVTLADGSQVDVHLDEDFNVLGEETDSNEDSDDEQDAEDGETAAQPRMELGGSSLLPFVGKHAPLVAVEMIDDGADLLPLAEITVEEAIAAARGAASGEIGEIDLEEYLGFLVFNVDVGSQDVKVDAKTGKVLGAVSDDAGDESEEDED